MISLQILDSGIENQKENKNISLPGKDFTGRLLPEEIFI